MTSRFLAEVTGRNEGVTGEKEGLEGALRGSVVDTDLVILQRPCP